MIKKKLPADLNQRAKAIVDLATEEQQPAIEISPKEEKPTKNPAAVALGRLGGLKGGKARAKKLTKEQRQDIARKAAQIRWKKTET